MRDLSMHVLDIAQNSIKAGAELVSLLFQMEENGFLLFSCQDDGCGMPAEFLARVTDPFTTTRTTRKVGLGIPMLKQSAEMCGGAFSIQSSPGVGTSIRATFDTRNIDCIPLGDICDSLLTLVVLNPAKPNFHFQAFSNDASAEFDTRKIRAALGDIALNEPDVIAWMRESIEEEFKPILEVY